jgi:hypothetical protein
MNLNKEKIANWLEKMYADDYFRFDFVSGEITVNNFEIDNNKLTVEYEYWDDGHANTGEQEYFLFDLAASDEYGSNVPAYMELVKMKGNYAWNTPKDLEELNDNMTENEEDVIDLIRHKWGDSEIDEFIDHYVPRDDKWLAMMLIEHYDARNGLPEFIPNKLRPNFETLVKLAPFIDDIRKLHNLMKKSFTEIPPPSFKGTEDYDVSEAITAFIEDYVLKHNKLPVGEHKVSHPTSSFTQTFNFPQLT